MDFAKEFICLSLCSGYGGIELGLRRIIPTLRTVAYVEIEAFACANLVAKMEKGFLDAAPIWTDIKTFNGWPFRKNIHIITAGYPCQPFSVAGKRKGTDDPRHLWPHIERILEAVRPVWFFGENVSGHLALGFPEVYRSLRNMGYAVEAGLFTAAECGAPHKRERLFVLAKFIGDGRCGLLRQAGQRTNRAQQRTNPHRQSLGDGGKRAPCQVANTTTQRIQRPEPEGATQAGRQIDEQSFKWPARPGQPQYEWEEPRVVAESDKCRHRGHRSSPEQNSNKQKNRISQPNSEHKERQTESRLGRAVDGTPCRVDRLRLLGNGIVPQQAAKAFRILYERFLNDENNL